MWIAAAAAVLVLAIVVTAAVVKLGNGVAEVDFSTLRTGASVEMGAAADVDFATTATIGDRAYYGWVANDAFHFHIAFDDDRDRAYPFRDILVLHLYNTKELRGLDWKDGRAKWNRPNPKTEYGSNDALMASETSNADMRGPATFGGAPTGIDFENDKQRLVQLGVDKKFYLIDAVNGAETRSWRGVGYTDAWYLAHDGKFFIAFDSPYRIQAYDLENQGEPANIYSSKDGKRKVDAMAMCGERRLCVLDSVSSDEKTAEVAAVDVAGQKELWRKPAAGADQLVAIGDQVLATNTSSPVSFLYSADGNTQLLSKEDQRSVGARVNARSLLFFSGQFSSYGTSDVSLIGVSAESGKRTALGPLSKMRGWSCSWNERAIVCATADKVQVWRFA